jgi:hypothetical protein
MLLTLAADNTKMDVNGRNLITMRLQRSAETRRKFYSPRAASIPYTLNNARVTFSLLTASALSIAIDRRSAFDEFTRV